MGCEGNNSNYENTYNCYAAFRGSHAFEFVHDRRGKTGAGHHHHYDAAVHREEEHGASAGNDHDTVVDQLLGSNQQKLEIWEGTRFGGSLFF